MSLVNFYRGPKEAYKASDDHKDGIYFATDTKELLMNGDTYGDTISSITFSEVTSGNDKGKVFASIEFASGNKIENIDTGCYGREELNSQLSGTNSIVTGLSQRVTILESSSSTPGSVAYQIALIVAGANTSYDTLKEIADWILNDTTGAAKMASDIENLKNDLKIDVEDANGHEYVEIAGIKWATSNIGDSVSLYFLWGDTLGYENTQVGNSLDQKYFGFEDYKYGTPSNFTKYSGSGTLELEDDAAYINWGGSWRMPTSAEFESLIEATNQEYTENGVTFIDKTDSSKEIFFAFAGYADSGTIKMELLNGKPTIGRYWASDGNDSYALSLNLSLNSVSNNNFNWRSYGCNIRPVLGTIKSPKYATKTELTELALQIGSDTALNDRITNLTGQEGSTYTTRSTEDASFIKNATNIQDALNKLDDVSMALTTLLTWQEVTPSPTPTAFWRMAQDQGTYPGLCLLTDSDGKVITIEDSVSHDTVVFTRTNTDVCYPEVLGSGVPNAALANFGTHHVENTATEGYVFTLGNEEYLVRQSVISPEPGEINDVLYSRSLLVDVNTWDVLVTKDGNVVTYIDGNNDNVCFVKYAGGEWHAETAYYDQVVEASALDPVSIGCTVADGVYTIKYGFNTYVMEEDSLTPEVDEWVHPENRLYAILNGEDYYLGNSDGKILLFTSQETEQCITLSESEGSWVFSEMSRGVPPTAESESADEEWSTNDTCTFTVGGIEYTMQIYNYQSSFITPNNIMKF